MHRLKAEFEQLKNKNVIVLCRTMARSKSNEKDYGGEILETIVAGIHVECPLLTWQLDGHH